MTSSGTNHKAVPRPSAQPVPVAAPTRPAPASVDLLSLDTPVVASSVPVQNHVPLQSAQAQPKLTSLEEEVTTTIL